MAKNNNTPDVYKGRRKKLNVLGIVLSAVAVLIVALFVLFGAFQKYIVYSNTGISLELPILATPGAEEDEARAALEKCGYACKPAIVSILLGLTPEEAAAALERADGRIAQVLRHASATP